MYSGMNKLWLRRRKVSLWMHTGVFVDDIQNAQHADLNMYQAYHH
jgi:hypothetical protein